MPTSTAISAQGSLLSIGTGAGSAKTLTAVALGNPTIWTSAAHGFVNGDMVTMAGVTGVNAALFNGLTFSVRAKTTNTFALDVDTRLAPLLTMFLGLVFTYFFTQIVENTFFVIDGLTAGVMMGNPKVLVGFVLYGLLSILILFIFIRFLSSWFVFTRKTFLAFVRRVTDPIMLPVQRLIPPAFLRSHQHCQLVSQRRLCPWSAAIGREGPIVVHLLPLRLREHCCQPFRHRGEGE